MHSGKIISLKVSILERFTRDFSFDSAILRRSMLRQIQSFFGISVIDGTVISKDNLRSCELYLHDRDFDSACTASWNP